MAEFDPYHEWLGIQPHEHPVDHYRLLGLERFEADLTRIGAAADQRMTYLHSMQNGPRGAYTQKLLNELAQARSSLLNPRSKTDYDQRLQTPAPSPLPVPSKSVVPGAIPTAQPMAPMAPQFAPAITTLPTVTQSVEAQPVAPPRVAGEVEVGEAGSGLSKAWIASLSVAFIGLIAALVWVIVAAVREPDRKTPPKAIAGRPVTSKDKPADRPKAMQELDGTVHFSPLAALLSGGGLQFVNSDDSGSIQGWNSPEQSAEWDFRIIMPSYFQLDITYATPSDPEGAELLLDLGEQSKKIELRNSGGASEFVTDTYFFMIRRRGDYQLVVKPTTASESSQLSLRSLRLTPKRK